MKTHLVKWEVGLSDGSSATEGRGEYEIQQGTLSPWQRLKQHIEKNELTITSLSLYCGEQRWNLPSAGNNPKFKTFLEAEKPIEYRFFRKMGAEILSGRPINQEEYAVIEAVYSDGKKLQTWVSADGRSSWSLICQK